MKRIQRLDTSVKTVLLALMALLGLGTLSHGHAAILFQETWSDLSSGATAVSSQRWAMTSGPGGQFVKSAAATPSLPGNWVAPVYGGEESVVLPQMETTTSFTLPSEGIDFSTQIVFTNKSSSGYFRLGLVATNHVYHNYWFEVRAGSLQLHKRFGNGSPTLLGSYTLAVNEWPLLEDATFTLRIAPAEEGYTLSLFMGENAVITLEDTTNLPNFSEGFRLFVATRDNQAGAIGKIALHSIPEGEAVALLTGGLALLAIGSRKWRGKE